MLSTVDSNIELEEIHIKEEEDDDPLPITDIKTEQYVSNWLCSLLI